MVTPGALSAAAIVAQALTGPRDRVLVERYERGRAGGERHRCHIRRPSKVRQQNPVCSCDRRARHPRVLIHALSMPDDAIAMRADHYDSFAESYARENETGLFNAHYARPAILDLAGDVAGRRILDAGCGAGPLAAALRDRGARVTGCDSSPGDGGPRPRAARTRRRGPRGRPGRTVAVRRGGFDDVVACLVLHYLEDWSGPLEKLRRTLRPGGRLILAVNHPAIRPVVYPDEDYFATSSYTEDYSFDGQSVDLTFWHRPLHAMTDAFTAAGFRISVISEPPFAPGTPHELLPPELGDRTAFLCFLFFVLDAV